MLGNTTVMFCCLRHDENILLRTVRSSWTVLWRCKYMTAMCLQQNKQSRPMHQYQRFPQSFLVRLLYHNPSCSPFSILYILVQCSIVLPSHLPPFPGRIVITWRTRDSSVDASQAGAPTGALVEARLVVGYDTMEPSIVDVTWSSIHATDTGGSISYSGI